MATISIFSIRLGRLLLTCERDAVFSYVLTCQGVRSPMSTDVAAALGGAASRMILFEAVKHLAPWPLNGQVRRRSTVSPIFLLRPMACQQRADQSTKSAVCFVILVGSVPRIVARSEFHDQRRRCDHVDLGGLRERRRRLLSE
jgi:hypothetical protein